MQKKHNPASVRSHATLAEGQFAIGEGRIKGRFRVFGSKGNAMMSVSWDDKPPPAPKGATVVSLESSIALIDPQLPLIEPVFNLIIQPLVPERLKARLHEPS